MAYHNKRNDMVKLLLVAVGITVLFSIGYTKPLNNPIGDHAGAWWALYLDRNIFVVNIQGISDTNSVFYQLLRNNGREILDITVENAVQYPDFNRKEDAERLHNIYVPKNMVDDLLKSKTILLLNLSYHEWRGFNYEEKTRMYGIEKLEDEVFKIENETLMPLNANSDFHTVMISIMNRKVTHFTGDDSLTLREGFDANRLNEYFEALRACHYDFISK